MNQVIHNVPCKIRKNDRQNYHQQLVQENENLYADKHEGSYLSMTSLDKIQAVIDNYKELLKTLHDSDEFNKISKRYKKKNLH